jgi:hypothetical protein
MFLRNAMVLDFAIRNNRVLLTRNCEDFKVLHQAVASHPGILGIYQDRNYSKDMSIKARLGNFGSFIRRNGSLSLIQNP